MKRAWCVCKNLSFEKKIKRRVLNIIYEVLGIKNSIIYNLNIYICINLARYFSDLSEKQYLHVHIPSLYFTHHFSKILLFHFYHM